MSRALQSSAGADVVVFGLEVNLHAMGDAGSVIQAAFRDANEVVVDGVPPTSLWR